MEEPLSKAEREASAGLEQVVGLLGLLHRIADELVDGPAYGAAQSLILTYRRRLTRGLAELENAADDYGQN
jgi:hypothetical protein